MPLYVASHTAACLTKQALRQLMQQLLRADPVQVRRCLASQIGGRMLTEAEAPDQGTLEKFFQSQRVNCEWIIRIDLEAQGGVLAEY